MPGVSTFFLLCCADRPPESLVIDQEEVEVSIKEDISMPSLTQLIQNLIDNTKVQIVAAKGGERIAKECAQKLML